MQWRATEQLAEARSLNAHIVQAEKLASLGQIAAGVVHELNNPLTSIVAYTDYLILKAANRAGGGGHGRDRAPAADQRVGRADAPLHARSRQLRATVERDPGACRPRTS